MRLKISQKLTFLYLHNIKTLAFIPRSQTLPGNAFLEALPPSVLIPNPLARRQHIVVYILISISSQ
jgi:hypothetical protein